MHTMHGNGGKGRERETERMKRTEVHKRGNGSLDTEVRLEAATCAQLKENSRQTLL